MGRRGCRGATNHFAEGIVPSGRILWPSLSMCCFTPIDSAFLKYLVDLWELGTLLICHISGIMHGVTRTDIQGLE